MQIDFYEDRLRSLLKNLEKVLCEEETEIEGFLYKLVLTGMEGKDCHTSARSQGIRQFFHKFI